MNKVEQHIISEIIEGLEEQQERLERLSEDATRVRDENHMQAGVTLIQDAINVLQKLLPPQA